MRYNRNGDNMKIKVGISMRHIHLTEEDYNLLFDEPITKKVDINQPGQYAANQTVTIENNNKRIKNVRIVGPFRNYTQVEISRTDAHTLGLEPPVRSAGDLEGASQIVIITPKGRIKRNAAIIIDRHIHITPEEREKYGLKDDEYSVYVEGEKGGILSNVKIKEAPNSYFELHLDADDGNAFNLKQNDEVEIVKTKR